MFLGKSDNRVNPSPSDGGNTPSAATSNAGGRAYASTRRPAAPATIGAGKSSGKSQKISKSVKAVKNFFKQPIRERNLAVVRDIGQTTTEIWITFIFTALVGSFFLGGGIYLIWLGKKDNVVDFVVVGGMGTLIGFCLMCVGMFLFCKPLCLAHRKREQESSQEKLKAMSEAEYVSKAKAKLLTLQIADSLTNRRPSHVELYGHPIEEGKPGSRIQSASSAATVYDPPPPVALPNKTKEGHGPGSRSPPVILMRETTEDDRLAINNAAERKDIAVRTMFTVHDGQNEKRLKSKANVIPPYPTGSKSEEKIVSSDSVRSKSEANHSLDAANSKSEANHISTDSAGSKSEANHNSLDLANSKPEANHISTDSAGSNLDANLTLSNSVISPTLETVELQSDSEKAAFDNPDLQSEELDLSVNHRREQETYAQLLDDLSMLSESEDINVNEDFVHAPRTSQSSDNFGTTTKTTALEVNFALEKDQVTSTERRRSVLSASNNRREPLPQETDTEEDDDTIVVIPH